MSFVGDIGRFNDKALSAANKVFRGTALEIFAAVIRRTPVDTGRLIGNWQASLDSPKSGEVAATGEGASIASATSATSTATIKNSLFMVNNLPYAKPIEEGHSKKAPAGMVAVTIAEFRRILERNARK